MILYFDLAIPCHSILPLINEENFCQATFDFTQLEITKL